MIKKLLLPLLLMGCVDTPTQSSVSQGVARSNAVMAQEFVELTYRTETGRNLEGLLKYEGPIRVSLSPSLSAYRGDLDDVLENMRRNAHIDIAIGAGGQIAVQQLPAALMKQNFPNAACVVASGVNSWAAFRRGDNVRWTSQQRLSKAAIFIPDDAPPYIVRACLNEEIGQALGPVNDLYHVADTIFNDDNVHHRLTGFDLLMLRVLYDERLSVGMPAATTLPIVHAILAEINPAGNIAGRGSVESAQWKRIIETAMISSNSRGVRVAAAQQAISMARGFNDHRLSHALMVYGRLNLRNAPQLAAPAFQEAYTISLNQLGQQNLRTAVTAMHIAAVALAAQQFEDVLTLVDPALPVAQRHGDEVLQAGLYSIRALALQGLDRNAEAQRDLNSSQQQARLAFGNDVERIANAQQQISGLVPAGQ